MTLHDRKEHWHRANPGIFWKCPECQRKSDLELWEECESYCEYCGVHDGRKCPICNKIIDNNMLHNYMIMEKLLLKIRKIEIMAIEDKILKDIEGLENSLEDGTYRHVTRHIEIQITSDVNGEKHSTFVLPISIFDDFNEWIKIE